MPRACGITRMSEKMIAASRGNLKHTNYFEQTREANLRIGCRVISQASSGVWQILKKSLTTRISLNSGKYLPAWFGSSLIIGVLIYEKTCLITQTGALSTFSPLAAFSNLSLSSFGKFSAVKEVISEGCNSTVGVLYMC